MTTEQKATLQAFLDDKLPNENIVVEDLPDADVWLQENLQTLMDAQ